METQNYTEEHINTIKGIITRQEQINRLKREINSMKIDFQIGITDILRFKKEQLLKGKSETHLSVTQKMSEVFHRIFSILPPKPPQ